VLNESSWNVRARDICILFRRFMTFGDDVTQPYVRALEARGVPHVLVGGKSFHNREEIETIRAALSAIEWPEDELSVFAALRGALFAIGDEELLEWKHRFGGFHPFRMTRSEVSPHLQPIADALRALQTLHRRRNYRPVAETVHDLIAVTRAHVGIVLRTAGEQALANVLHVAELAREYEASGGLSFRGFVDELHAAAGAAQSAEAPILEEASDGVRLMTVHKAKGLEFPIVVLADLTCKLSRAEAGRWLDPDRRLCALKLGGWSPIDLLLHDPEEAARDKAESERLTYVASTRAKDLLVVPAIGDAAYEGGWLEPVLPAIYPPENVRRSPQAAKGVPLFKSKDTVLNRPDGDPATSRTVAPGTFTFDNYAVTWWDPHSLRLGAESSFGLRRDDLIVKDGDMFAVEERLADYERWRDGRADVIARAAQPSVRFTTVTAWAAEAAEKGIDAELADGEIEIVEISDTAARPRGALFGSLVHALLAAVPLDATDAEVERIAATHGRLLQDVTPADISASARIVVAVLRHDLMARARASGSVRRETPVSWVQKDGVMIEGVLDLAFDENGETVVVDFKTDHELAAGEARYRAQLRQYLNAVSRVTGRPASGVLFRV